MALHFMENDDAIALAVEVDRERRRTILGCAEAQGRGALAVHLAHNEFTLDEALAILRAAPADPGEMTADEWSSPVRPDDMHGLQ